MRIEPNPRFQGSDPVHRPGLDPKNMSQKADGTAVPGRTDLEATEPAVAEDVPALPAEIIGDGVFVPEAILRRERLRTSLEESQPAKRSRGEGSDIEDPARPDESGKPRLPDGDHAREAGRKVIEAIPHHPIGEAHDPRGTDATTVRKLLDPNG
jgi:hypothetical protein